MKTLTYTVATIRNAGLQARWGKTSAGAPIIFARIESGKWFAVDRKMWEAAKSEGIFSAFERFTLLGDIFSIAA